MITPMNSSNKIINKTINSNEIPKQIKDYKKSLNFDKNEKNYKTFMNFKYNDQKNIHSQTRLRNKNINLINKIVPHNYYMTSSNFISTSDSIKQKKSCKDINNFLDRINNNKSSINKKFKYRNFNLNNNAQKFISTVNNSYKGANNANNNNINNAIKLKKIPKIKLNWLKLLELENNFNEAYNNNFTKVNEKKKDIKKEKEKCKHILGELDKQNNYDIQQIIGEINSQLLGLNFNDFYNYLLTILKNYDKKIVNWSFDIVEDKKECPEELKFINVRHRHQKFKGMLDRQYVCGVNVNNHINHLIKNSKSKLGFINNDYYEKLFLHENKQKNNLIEKLFTENNYRSKFYEKFLKNKNNSG
jgi:hypothetical protein